MEKMPDMGSGTSYKDGLCPKLEKNLSNPKLGPQNVWYDTSWPFLRKSIGICSFWLKLTPKSHFV